MSLEDVKLLLGEPAAHIGRDEFLSKFRSAVIFTDDINESKSRAKEEEWYLWRRPEGDYKLTFRKQILTEINAAP
jgi:hypothetical protein